MALVRNSILVVDDNPNNLRVLCELLERNHYDVRPAISGDVALNAILKLMPDLILLDIRMSGKDGFQVCEELKKNPITQDIPIIFISAVHDMDQVVKGFDVGGADYITKPVESKIVLARVKAQLSIAQSRNELAEKNDALHQLSNNLEELVDQRTEEIKNANEKLQESKSQLRDLSAHIQRVREDEKIRIAKDVHDELGATLTALNLDIHWLQKQLKKTFPDVCDKVINMEKLINEASDACRRIVTELRPAVLDDLGLLPAIEWQANDFSKRHGFPCQVTTNVDDISISKGQAIVVFRIFQEALTNISKHAKAYRVEVVLVRSDTGLMLQVIDDGIGLAGTSEVTAAKTTSYGIRGMLERALSVGGTLAVESDCDARQKNGGTRVILHLPLALLDSGGLRVVD